MSTLRTQGIEPTADDDVPTSRAEEESYVAIVCHVGFGRSLVFLWFLRRLISCLIFRIGHVYSSQLLPTAMTV